MTPEMNKRPRPHRSPLAMLSACALVAGSLTFALLPLVASANTGNIRVTENCQTWSAEVTLTNNVDASHLVDVIVSPSFGHPGFTARSFNTVGAAGDTTIWGPFTGSTPLIGSVTLTIHNPNGTIENSQTRTIQPPAPCHAPAISTSLSSGSIVVPGTVHDSAALTGATSTAGGTVAYSVFTDTACTQGVRDAGTKTVTNGSLPDSSSLVFNSAGTVYWQAAYSGDANNMPARSACREETLVVNKSADTAATVATPAAGVVGISGTFGDAATLSGAFQPTGSVTFGLYADAGCLNAVNGVSGAGQISRGAASFSTTWTPTAAGIYYWKAVYVGDANNLSFAECGGAGESLTVAAPATGTQGSTVGTSPAGGTLGAATGAAPGLPAAGHPATGVAPSNTGGALLGTILVAVVLLMAGGAVLLLAHFHTLFFANHQQ